MHNAILILLILVSVLLSAMFSSGEIASARSNKLRFRKAAEGGDKVAKAVTFINDNYVRSLSTILAGNNFVNIVASSAATVLFTDLLGSRGEAVAGIVITIVLLFFGETCPKIMAAGAPDRFMRLLARPLVFCMYLLFPIVWLVEKLMTWLSPLWTPKETGPQVTPEELCEILDDIEEEGVFTEDESELIRSAIEFTETTANEILTPRVDVIAIDIDDFDCRADLNEELLVHSRIPVYRESKDNVIGILPTKWLMKEMISGKEPISIEDLLIRPVYVHMTCPISTIIDEFREQHAQMAIVIDEFGGMLGIVTLEDIVEEIVGDIYDEMDDPVPEVAQQGQNTFLVDGSFNIFDTFESVGYEPEADFETEYTTAGGWASEILDKIPEEGDCFDYDGLHVTVKKMEGMRVEELEITVTPGPPEMPASGR